MTANAEVAVSGAVHVFRIGCIVDGVARTTVDPLAISRIDDLLTHRMGDSVLMCVTGAAELNRRLTQEKRPLPTVGRMTGGAGEIGVAGVASFQS